ncbi:hypothetical protein ACLOJK_030094 [Asimina triloba]
METDSPPSSENPDQVIWNPEEQGSNHARSYYECTFCKKGFSNAQALGGHMNIHRRDRARLKHPSNAGQPANLDATKRDTNPLFAPVAADQDHSFESPSDDHRSSSIKWPWGLPADAGSGIQRGELQQLPLFVDMPNTVHGDDHQIAGHGRDEDGRIQGSHEDLDLELRLGPEPQDMSLAGHKKSP